MTRNLILFISAGLASAAVAMQALPGHVDLRWTWDAGAARWSMNSVSESAGTFHPDNVFLPLGDKPYRPSDAANSGARLLQPDNSTKLFTGVAVGNPIWYAVVSLPGTGEAWPGFESLQGNTVFGEYFESDHRLPQPQTIARPWIRISMGRVFHDGSAPAKFSMWTGTGSAPRVWMSTTNGQTDNLFLLAGGTHAHMNWTFGDLGIYRIGLSASAYLGPGQTNPTGPSDEFTATFAVGPVAQWQATFFNGEELENPAISGLAADANGDGQANLIGYAFGLNPRTGDRTPHAPGLGLPETALEQSGGKTFQVIRFPRRKAGESLRPLIYTPQFSETLKEGDWTTGGAETVTDIDGIWERVEIRRELGAQAAPRGFGRVMVHLPG
jgi:surface-anchored protein